MKTYIIGDYFNSINNPNYVPQAGDNKIGPMLMDMLLANIGITIVGYCSECTTMITSNMSYNLVEHPIEGNEDIPLCNRCAE